MGYSKILEKQLKRFLPVDSDTTKLAPLLQVISDYYETLEHDKKLSEHAFSISEKEYQEVLQSLKEQDEIKRHSVEKLKGVLQLLDQRLGLNKAGEDDLMAIVTDLEQEVERSRKLKTELRLAKEEAENLARAKGNFLSIMSHEIRTPLNAIIGSIHLLEKENHLPQQEPLINSLRISSNNLLSLINDILDFTKIEEGKITFAEKPVNLTGLLRNLREVHGYKARENENRIEITLDPHLPEFILGDDTRLNQILNNLISNAIKFTHRGIISVSAQLLDNLSDNAVVRFSVRDTGIGIDQKNQARIFERFTQANSEIDRKYGGSGLGLTIVKKLVELWGGQIELESSPGEGSTFSFNLTLKRAEEPAKKSAEKKSAEDLSGIHILLVEDTELNVRMAERMLTHWHATVDIARNGKLAIDKCKDGHYDIILMDIHMPVMDGLTASKIIRTFDPMTPIIALSASTEVNTDIYEAGMSDSVAKPFNPQEFLKLLLRWSKGAVLN